MTVLPDFALCELVLTYNFSMRAAIAAFLLCRCLTGQQVSLSGVTAAGVAVDSVTQQPLPGVHVSLYPEIRESRMDAVVYGAISKEEGRFSINGVTPGIYTVMAACNGYLLAEDQTVTLKPAEPVASITIKMAAEAVISGTVSDEFGDPVRHAWIATEPARGSTQTDERGWFRMPLPPGKFRIKATVQNLNGFSMPEIRADGLKDPVYGPAYSDSVELQAGQIVQGMNIRLTPSRSLTISGTVTGSRTGNPVVVAQGDWKQDTPHVTQTAFVHGANGAFTFHALPSGHYIVVAQEGDLRSAPYEARLDNLDIEGVNLALVSPETLTGSVEGVVEKAYVRLAPSFGPILSAPFIASELGAGGAFRVEKVFPGKYRVSVAPLPENAYVKSVKVDGVEAADLMVDFTRGIGVSKLKVTVSPNGGRIEGVVLTEQVAWVAIDSDADAEKVDKDGRFHFSGLHPGKYRVVAYRGERPSFEGAPEVEVKDGDRVRIEVKLSDAKR